MCPRLPFNLLFVLLASVLATDARGCVAFTYRVRHQDGTSETGSRTIPDWNNGASPAWTANGRADVGTFGFSSVNGGNPRLYSLDVTLSNSISPVTSVGFAYASGSGQGAIMAVSGSKDGGFTPIAVTGTTRTLSSRRAGGALQPDAVKTCGFR